MDQLQIHYVDLGVPRITDLKSDLSIGRTEGNDLVLNHPSVSRVQAGIKEVDNAYYVFSLRPKNGPSQMLASLPLSAVSRWIE